MRKIIIFLLLLFSHVTWGKRGQTLTNQDNKPADEEDLSQDEDENSNEMSNMLPPHKFKFKETIGQKGIYKGKRRVFVTLSCPPWEFKRKSKSEGDGQEVFICCGCDVLERQVSCTTFKTVTDSENSTKDQYQIFESTWLKPEMHICAPSGYADYVDRCRQDMLR